MKKANATSTKYKDELIEIIQKSAKNKAFLDEFFKDLLTPKEYETLAIRWQIVKMLAEGAGQREITTKLKTGIATVTRGSRELRNHDGAFMKLLESKMNASWRSNLNF